MSLYQVSDPERDQHERGGEGDRGRRADQPCEGGGRNGHERPSRDIASRSHSNVSGRIHVLNNTIPIETAAEISAAT